MRQLHWARYCGALWGIGGIVALLVVAIVRLSSHAFAAISSNLSLLQWIILLAWCAFMIASEGRDGFDRRLAPRIAARAQHIKLHGDFIDMALAPLYCFGYFRSSRRQMAVSYVAIILILFAVLVVHQFSQPWRGIIDCGVVLGLAYGIVCIIRRCVAAHVFVAPTRRRTK